MTVDRTTIHRAAEALRRGELVAFPTETVYGLGADATNPAAVRRIFAAKGRPADHPVIVHLASAAWLERWAAPLPPEALRLAGRFWPGPLTMILPRAPHVLDAVTGGQPTVGLRVPDHPVARSLLEAFGGGVAAPSANRFGRISPTRAEHVIAELGHAALVLDGGPSRVGLESTIVDLSGSEPVLLRPGFIGVAELEAVLARPISIAGAGRPATTRAPGMLASHYAPATPLELVEPAALPAALDALQAAGLRGAVLSRRQPPETHHDVAWRVAPYDATDYASQLYAALRELDALGYDRILVEAVPDDDAWLAVRDRLHRAAHRGE